MNVIDPPGRLCLAFYGDDFTGSSENLAQFHRSGLRSKLYLRLPSVEGLLQDAKEFHILGIAGTARALNLDDMEAELAPAFKLLARLDCPFLQYKNCSTFDSSETVGSFGRALELAPTYFGHRRIAVLAATPDFGRYTAFGQHFARFGKAIERLDRHPSMSMHPRTPMTEADLRLHLSQQSKMSFENIMLPTLRDEEECRKRVESAFKADHGIIFDGVENSDLRRSCEILWEISRSQPVLALAAQGLAQNLGAHLAESGIAIDLQDVQTVIQPVDRLLVLSGSCALQNGRQIDAAEAAGWKMVPLNPALLVDERHRAETMGQIMPVLADALERRRPVVVYTARGHEGRLESGDDVPAPTLGAVYSDLAKTLRAQVALQRVVFAGGDSSSYAVRVSGALALEISVFDKEQNSHVCRLSAPGDASLDGLEVMLKGGQIGSEDYFLRALSGTR
jgi:3-oxoisoapionate kinase